ncbi:MAG: NAD(P)H-hydrate dehydratase, partial [Bacteroidaceae bacterium]|nr:NAD(P)H-hydrate dehydratase [Bacteroidaceae bacterium]
MKATKWQEMELAMMVGMYRERPPEAHKGNMGHALLVAGQTGIAGCALLAAESCMRSGVGKLTVFTPEENRLILQLGLPEAIVDTRFATPTDCFQAIGAGPGMGTDHTAMERLQNLLQTHRPMVLDADALSLIAKAGFFTASGHIFTPHAREMERLANGMKLEGSSLTEKAVHLATSFRSHVILKGHP